MKSLGRRPEGARLERIKASPLWDGERFTNDGRHAHGVDCPGTVVIVEERAAALYSVNR